jgi:hypothetical protein
MKRVLMHNQVGSVPRNQTATRLLRSSAQVFKSDNASRSSGAVARAIDTSVELKLMEMAGRT